MPHSALRRFSFSDSNAKNLCFLLGRQGNSFLISPGYCAESNPVGLSDREFNDTPFKRRIAGAWS